MTRRHRLLGPSVLLVALLFSLLAPASAGARQDDAEAEEAAEDAPPVQPAITGELHLVSQVAYVAADGEFTATLQWDGPTSPDLTVATVVRARVDREAQLADPTGTLNRLEPVPLVSLVDGTGLLTMRIPIRSFSPASPDEPDRILIPDAGVYPIDISIVDPFGTVASVTTTLIRLPTDTTEGTASGVALILPTSPSEGLGVMDVTELLERHPDVPLTVYIDTAASSILIAEPALAERFAAALGERDLMAANGVDLDPSSLARIGRGDLFTEATVASRATLAEVGLGVAPELAALEPDLTVDGATLLRDQGTEVVFDLEGDAQGVIETRSGDLEVVSVDTELTSSLIDSENPVVAAHDLLAHLALRSENGRDSVLLGGSGLNTVDPASLDILFSAFAQIGPVEMVTVGTYADQRPRLTLRPRENPAQDLASSSASIDRIGALLETFDSFYVSGPDGPSTYRTSLVSALSRDRNPTDRSRTLDQLIENLGDELGVIQIQEGQSVTLTAQRLTVPLTIVNGSNGERSIRFDFDSDKIEVDEDGDVLILPPGTSSVDITVEARSLGLSPLTVQARTPSAAYLLAESSIQVRSTAIPGLGLLLSGAAISFLVGWWIVSAARSRVSHDTDDEQAATDTGQPAVTSTARDGDREGVNVGDGVSDQAAP